MNFINKLERKFGKYAIHNLMYYIVGIYVLGALVSFAAPGVYQVYLSLDMQKVFQGQVWRLVTFLIMPSSLNGTFNLIFFFFEMYMYYMIGSALERSWGAFRFNLYFLSGILFNIVAATLLSFFLPGAYPNGLTYINQSMFFAFAALYPNVEFLLFLIIPVKVKWLAYLSGGFLIYEVLRSFSYGPSGVAYGVAILVGLANFFIFFLNSRSYRRMKPSEIKRKVTYKREVKNASSLTRHKCSICGRTELDDENLEFRFCSKCDGNHEYCTEHLFSHEHVKHGHK